MGDGLPFPALALRLPFLLVAGERSSVARDCDEQLGEVQLVHLDVPGAEGAVIAKLPQPA